MKKTFNFETSTVKADRKVEAIRSEIKKYFARERRKKLPEGFNFWNFDCKFGTSADDAESVAESEIKDRINQVLAENYTSFYLEIIARPDNKSKKKK